MADDLWPANLTESNLVTPVAILREQAALLGDKTKQLVTGEVQTQTTGNLFVHSFCVAAPTLNYRYELFRVQHPAAFYPLVLAQGRTTTQVESEDEFKNKLKEVFSSQLTLNVVHSILAQVRS
jgi:hypothetical protein